MKSSKTNPRRRPATHADVGKALKNGIMLGCQNASVIILSVLVDKFNAADYIPEVWAAVNKLSEEIAENRVSVADLRTVLREEYGIEV